MILPMQSSHVKSQLLDGVAAFRREHPIFDVFSLCIQLTSKLSGTDRDIANTQLEYSAFKLGCTTAGRSIAKAIAKEVRLAQNYTDRMLIIVRRTN